MAQETALCVGVWTAKGTASVQDLWVAFSDCSMCIFSLRAGFQLSTLEACGFVQSSWRFSEKLCVPVSRGMCGASEF